MFDLSEAPFKEIAVVSNTTEAAAVAARKRLQAVLDEHVAAPAGDVASKKVARKAKRAAKKAGQNP